MCTAMSRIFVAQEVYDSFVAEFVSRAGRITLGNSLNYETQMGPLISQGHRRRVLECIARAKKEGVRLLCGGTAPDDPVLRKGFFLTPTVLEGALPQTAIFQEEIFGPVVCLTKFKELDEAVALANSTDFGLASSIWTKDISLAQETARRIQAGTVWINTYGMFYNELPYGGFKQSGFGKELGKEGFLEYTRLKNVVIDETPTTSKPLVNYWYGF